MILMLKLVRETDKARFYENRDGQRQWVPRSVCRRTLKFGPAPGVAGALPEHEVDVEDWWLEKNPFGGASQEEMKF